MFQRHSRTVFNYHVLLLATVRLAGSGLLYEGRLEVYYNGAWGTVCDDDFENVDATVACKSLGLGLSTILSLYNCRSLQHSVDSANVFMSTINISH